MSYSKRASSQSTAKHRRRSSRKANANHIFGSAAVACLVLGCAWNIHANVFGASIYPTVGNFDAADNEPAVGDGGSTDAGRRHNSCSIA